MNNHGLSSILPNMSKLFERCMYNQINYCFETLLSKFHYGFQKGNSAQHCLLCQVSGDSLEVSLKSKQWCLIGQQCYKHFIFSLKV